ncbi:hypothetical protein QJS04_geneDACA000795 [Acorus gramineus]|uniref:Uncharacterized protein n=1 Tax=Acorus gramineus TaxID=55184 RepID=A0AAV9BJ28_ACOGR|nr:hypothetical protein QJS04_geneDACA000795 [Acorus gramineus]
MRNPRCAPPTPAPASTRSTNASLLRPIDEVRLTRTAKEANNYVVGQLYTKSFQKISIPKKETVNHA